MTEPKYPPPNPPPPRTDLPAPEGMSEEDYAAFLADLAEDGPAAWIDTDGTLYLEYMPRVMAPAGVGMVDGPVGIAPDSPQYAQYAPTVLRYFNYQGEKEVPDATGTDDDAERG